jgi:PAS domain S-box-containing protein
MTFSNIEWSLLFQDLPAPCLVLDQDLCIVTASKLYLKTVGRELDEIQGLPAFEVFPEELERRTMFEGAFRRALAGEANSLLKVPYAIPIVDDDGQPTGKVKEIWWSCHHNPVFQSDGTVRYMVQNAQDITEQVMAKNLKDAVVGELHHRVGNIFSLVSATARRMASSADDLADFMPKFQGCLMALARTNTYLTGDNWDGITIDKIVNRELAELGDIGSGQITATGAVIVVNATEAQILTMAVHELATNAIKYGALKTRDGKLDVVWKPNATTGFDFEWRESNVIITETPPRQGFGSFILEQIVPAQLQATAQRDLRPDGFVYQLSVTQRTASH